MTAGKEPFVSVVTPVYNGGKFLRECLQSVVDQTHGNWELVVVDNCSKDETAAIAEEFASMDARIRVHGNEEFLAAIPNHNHALRMISPHSRYCKVLQADDYLYPRCLELLVGLAESHPSVGIVSSLRKIGEKLDRVMLPAPGPVFNGREICADAMRRDDHAVFGSMSTTLFRAELIREHSPFFVEGYAHADTDACYRCLRDWDFGFQKEILSYTRLHDDTQTERVAKAFGTGSLERLFMLLDHGPDLFDQEEMQELLLERERAEYRTIAKFILGMRGGSVVGRHVDALNKRGLRVNKAKLSRALMSEVWGNLTRPGVCLDRIRRRMKCL